MGRRWKTRHLVRQHATKGRARFDAGIPVLGIAMFLPWHVAQIVDGREMGGGRDVGQGIVAEDFIQIKYKASRILFLSDNCLIISYLKVDPCC